MPINDDFVALLGTVQADIDASDLSTRWQPPACPGGTLYNCQLVECNTGAKPAEGQKKAYVWARLTWRIIDGEYKGQDFGAFYTSNPAFKLAPLFNLVTLATKNADIATTKNLHAACKTLDTLSGRLLVNMTALDDSYTTKAGEQRSQTVFQYNKVIDILKA